jgi:glycosyltransferase involved in cell wall biosynthesis
MYPEADLFALFADESSLPSGLKSHRLQTSFLNRSRFLRENNRAAFPLYPLAIESLDVSKYDLVITSDSPPMKGVITTKDQAHVCYCHTPGRFLWDYYETFKSTLPGFIQPAFSVATEYLRRWDYAAAQNVDTFVANSDYVQQRISRFYNRHSTVVYPPVDTAGGFLAHATNDAYLHVGRLVHSKRIDLLIRSCNQLSRRLLVVGTGRDEEKLKAIAGPTIEFLGRVPDSALPNLYAHCRALLFAADEDFGIVPLECQAYGRPVIAYARGGSLETIRPLGVPEPTGLFFENQSVDSLTQAILAFEGEEHRFNPARIQAWARTFDTSSFMRNMTTVIEGTMSSGLTKVSDQQPNAAFSSPC